MHEASLFDSNCFITLTYSDVAFSTKGCGEIISPRFSLFYSDFQLFMKRLRARFRARIRFYMAGEYGEINSRPHFHACLFGFDFPDKVYFKTSSSGCKLYTSELLASLWPAGFSSVGAVTFESAAYVARYCMSKVSGKSLLAIVDPDSGEIFERVKEFAHMSLKPGIGAEWLRRFKSDVYPHGEVVVNGKEARPPRYYDQQFRKGDAAGWIRLCVERSKEAPRALQETAPGRLGAREAVSKARMRKGVL